MTKSLTQKLARLAIAGGTGALVGRAITNSRRSNVRRQVLADPRVQAAKLESQVIARARNDYIAGKISRTEFKDAATRVANKYGLNSIKGLSGAGAYGVRELGGDVLTGIGAGLGGLAGSFAGPVGSGVGSAVGGGIGREIANIGGMGKYTVGMNSIATTGDIVPEGYEVPTFGTGANGTRIQHREYIKDLVIPANPTTFNNSSFTINPGNSLLFPWLSTIASQYQQYEFLGCVFSFKTLSSDITGGGALGAVIMATNYDVLEVPFTSKISMENTQYTVSAKPSFSQIHCLECDPSQRVMKLQYIRGVNSSTSASQDARFYDMGNFQVATQGLPGSAGVVLGELWVTYDVMLHKPEVVSFGSPTQVLSANSPSTSNPLGSTTTLTGNTIVSVSGLNDIQFNTVGSYVVQIIKQGTGLHSNSYSGSVGHSIGNGPFPSTTLTTHTSFVIAVVTQPGQFLAIDCTADTTLTGFTVQLCSVAPGVWGTG